MGLGQSGISHGIGQHYLDFTALDNTPVNNMDNIFMSKPHEYLHSNSNLEKNYSTPFPFASLAAGNSH